MKRAFGPGTVELDRIYVGDITYIWTWEGWLYLASVIDLSSRRVVGWAMADHMRADLVCDVLTMAIDARRPEPGLISIPTAAPKARHLLLRPSQPLAAGHNENTNGLLRQYFPKGTDLARHSRDDLYAVAGALNMRPRKTLGWKTPAEALDELLRSA